MASKWSTIRAEIELVLEASPLSLTKVNEGISILGSNPMPLAGRDLFADGYFIAPRLLRKGPTMERLSKDRELGFQIYHGIELGEDYTSTTDLLYERSDSIIQKLCDCNTNIPSADLVDLSGDVQFSEDFEDLSYLFAIMPFRCVYRLA